MPHRQKLSVRAKMLMRCREALRLTSEGLSQIEVSHRMGVSTDSVKRYVQRALATESTFPSTLDSGQIGALRQIEAERLTKLWQKVQSALDQILPRLGTEGERSLDGTAIARLVASGVAVSEQISRLFGLHAPVKIIEQQLRVSYRKTESKIHISFDRSPIEALARQPVAGLTITANSETNGNGTKQLHYTDPLPLAGEIPRD
jgi:transposase